MKSDLIKYIIVIIVLSILSAFFPVLNDFSLGLILFLCGVFIGEHKIKILNFFKKKEPE